MDYTEGTEEFKIARSKKQMLWFGIISLCMTFAGLTSAYIVSMERRDWLENYDFPQAFYSSTFLIIGSSLTIHFARKAVIANKKNQAFVLMLATFALGIGFVITQLLGFAALTDQGYYFTGAASTITTTFLFLIIAVHMAHVVAGFIVLLTVIVNLLRGKYSKSNHLGVDLGVTFWHFLDLLWIFLLVLLYVTK